MASTECYKGPAAAASQSIEGGHTLDTVRILSMALSVLVACMVARGVDAAPPEGKGKPDKDSTPQVATDPGSGDAIVASLIHPDLDYDRIRRIAVEQHYTGHKALPPGIAKNLARGKPLPPGIAKKSPRAEFVRQLPAYPDYEWRRCGTDLVLVQVATQVVAEVLANIFQ
jgi:Ni/Co efflux regulator RcnB